MKNNNENNNNKKIIEWIEGVRFRKKFFGGVSEEDVWKKIEELNKMYQASLEAERVRYDTMIEHYKNSKIETCDSEMVYDE